MHTAPGHGSTALGDQDLVATDSDFQSFLQVQMTILGIERHGHPGSQLCMTDSLCHIT